MPVYEYDQFGQPIGIMNTGTIGGYTGYDMGSAPMQPMPTLPQTYAPTPGNPNFPVLTTPLSTFGIPTQPTATLGGKMFTPQTAPKMPSLYNSTGFDANLQKAFTQNAAGAIGGLGGAAGAVGGALTKLNPYLAMGTAALGTIQSIGGLIGLARTKQPEGFKLTPNMQQAIGESETAARFGLGPQQIALAQQNQREAQNTQLYNARSMAGGNLSRSIFGANTFNRLMAGNQLASQDFAAQQQKIGLRNQLYGQEQAIANQNVQLAQQDYMRKQQAYGGAMSSGLTNLGSFFNLQNALRYNA
jgi:hypothetical protein